MPCNALCQLFMPCCYVSKREENKRELIKSFPLDILASIAAVFQEFICSLEIYRLHHDQALLLPVLRDASLAAERNHEK